MEANNEHFSVLSYLLEQDSCPVNNIEVYGQPLLHYAVLSNDSELFINLLRKGVDINKQNGAGETPVFVATRNFNTASLRVLLESGANPNIFTNNGSFALYGAVGQGNVEAALVLLKHGSDTRMIGQGNCTVLSMAIDRHDLHMMKILLDHGADMEQICFGEMTALLIACVCGFLEGVKTLIERGANIRARSKDGFTSLIVAAKKGDSSIASYLLDKDSSCVTDTATNGYGVLHYSSFFNHAHLTELVISKGANINAQSQDGTTPVFIATENSHVDCLQVLLESGADPNIGTQDGEFALHEAVNQHSTMSVRLLLKHGADRTKTGRDGLTPIQRALTLTPSIPFIVESLRKDYLETRPRVEGPSHSGLGEEEKLKKLGHEVKECIYCPITRDVMRDPVIAADGHTYERRAIETWLRQKQESPVTRQPMPSSAVTPNLSIRHLINQYLQTFEDQ